MAALKRDYVLFLCAFSLVEALLSVAYYQLVGKIDLTLFAGALLYAIVVSFSFLSFRHACYRQRRQELLDGLLS